MVLIKEIKQKETELLSLLNNDVKALTTETEEEVQQRNAAIANSKLNLQQARMWAVRAVVNHSEDAA